MTRQRQWQIKQKALGNCEICGSPASIRHSTRCEQHNPNRFKFPRKLWRKAIEAFAQ